MTVQESLTATLEILREDGWRQNAMGLVRGVPHCVLGALYLTPGEHVPAQTVIRGIIKAREPLIRQNISDWNDKEGRTFDEVQELLLTAING